MCSLPHMSFSLLACLLMVASGEAVASEDGRLLRTDRDYSQESLGSAPAARANSLAKQSSPIQTLQWKIPNKDFHREKWRHHKAGHPSPHKNVPEKKVTEGINKWNQAAHASLTQESDARMPSVMRKERARASASSSSRLLPSVMHFSGATRDDLDMLSKPSPLMEAFNRKYAKYTQQQAGTNSNQNSDHNDDKHEESHEARGNHDEGENHHDNHEDKHEEDDHGENDNHDEDDDKDEHKEAKEAASQPMHQFIRNQAPMPSPGPSPTPQDGFF